MVTSRNVSFWIGAACVAVLSVAASSAERGAPPNPASGQDRGAAPAARPAADAEPTLARLPDENGWRLLIANDARIAFTQRTAGQARAVLDTPSALDEGEDRRAIAMVGLGAADAVVERTRLERIARSGTELERRAAVLALGEMSAGTDTLFEEWIAKAEVGVAECALLALLRTGHASARRRVEEIAADPSQRLAKVAADLLLFTSDRASSRPTRAAVLLLRTRFDAARQWGLIDGETWESLAVRKLSSDPRFVREVVMSAAGGLRGGAARDHVLAELLHGTDLARLRTAIAILPGEVSDLVDAGLWKPADANQWTTMLDEISARHLERFTLSFLRAAMQDEDVRCHAIALAAIAGDEDVSALSGIDVKRLSADDRVWIALAVGSRTEDQLLERFSSLAKDESAKVRMAWLVAEFRHGDSKAADKLENKLNDASADDHRVLVLALCAAARDPFVAETLETFLGTATEEEAILVAVALGIEGRADAQDRVRAALTVEPPPKGLAAVRLVRALRGRPQPEDLIVLRRLFPSVTEDRALDRELVLALYDHSDPEMMPILRAGLWSSETDMSLLAGGLIVQASGVVALIQELRVPPSSATSRDLRRVGFAIGEWGGVSALEALSRELRWSSGEPALQGALLGVLSTRTQ
jgi:hypothetical protein